MPVTAVETEEKVVRDLFRILQTKMTANEEEFTNAAKELTNFLLRPHCKAALFGTAFIERFVTEELVPLAYAAIKIRRNIFPYIKEISKAYEIPGGLA